MQNHGPGECYFTPCQTFVVHRHDEKWQPRAGLQDPCPCATRIPRLGRSTLPAGMQPLSLPLDQLAIQRILPHRFPFLLVDRITELEPDRRIVGIKAVTSNEPHLTQSDSGRPVLTPTILIEAVAQVGAIMILAKPENRDKLIFFLGIDWARFRSSRVCGRRDRHRSGRQAAAEPDGAVPGHSESRRPPRRRGRHDVRPGHRRSAVRMRGVVRCGAGSALDRQVPTDRGYRSSRCWSDEHRHA